MNTRTCFTSKSALPPTSIVCRASEWRRAQRFSLVAISAANTASLPLHGTHVRTHRPSRPSNLPPSSSPDLPSRRARQKCRPAGKRQPAAGRRRARARATAIARIHPDVHPRSGSQSSNPRPQHRTKQPRDPAIPPGESPTTQFRPRFRSSSHHGEEAEIPHHRRAPHLHGHDRLLQDLRAAAHPPPAQHAQVRSRRAEAGPVPRAEARKMNVETTTKRGAS